MNRQRVVGATVIAALLVGVWASSREPVLPEAPKAALADGLPQAAADITTVTAAPPSPTVSPTLIVLTFEPEPTLTVVYIAPPPADTAVPLVAPSEAPAASLPDTPADVPATAAPQATAYVPYVPPPPAPPDPSVAGAEQSLIDNVNYQRSLYGLGAYARDETLMQIARSRVADMVARGYFGHGDPVTGGNLARSQILGAGYSRAGENIFRSGSDLTAVPASAVGWFMTDQIHRDAILAPGYTAIGAGIAADGPYWVVALCFAS